MIETPKNENAELSISFKGMFYVLASLVVGGIILTFGQTVLVPIAFAVLLAFILYPIAAWLEKKGASRIVSIILTLLAVTLSIAGITYVFSAQMVSIVKDFDDFTTKLNEILNQVVVFLNKNVSIIPSISKDSLKDMGMKWFSNNSRGVVSNTINATGLFLTGLTLTIIYTFLMLLYRDGITMALSHFVAPEKREGFKNMLCNMRKVGQQYVAGMFVLILILGILNTTGLLIIGIDYPLFFGFLAAFLAVIPYIGTTIGGAIPALYAFMNNDSYWVAISVVLVFWFIQFLEGNFLSPRIVGGNLNINALAAILALISGGLFWGIAGMVLFLPFTAIVKVACDHYKELKPVGMLLKDDLYQKSNGNNLKGKIKKFLKLK